MSELFAELSARLHVGTDSPVRISSVRQSGNFADDAVVTVTVAVTVYDSTGAALSDVDGLDAEAVDDEGDAFEAVIPALGATDPVLVDEGRYTVEAVVTWTDDSDAETPNVRTLTLRNTQIARYNPGI